MEDQKMQDLKMKDLLRLRRSFVVSCEQTRKTTIVGRVTPKTPWSKKQCSWAISTEPPRTTHDRSTARRQRTADPASTQEALYEERRSSAEVLCEVWQRHVHMYAVSTCCEPQHCARPASKDTRPQLWWVWSCRQQRRRRRGYRQGHTFACRWRQEHPRLCRHIRALRCSVSIQQLFVRYRNFS